MNKTDKESIKWANSDIDIYYQFLQTHNPTAYTLSAVYSHEGDADEFSNFDAIQIKRYPNSYNLTMSLIELKGRYKDLNTIDTAIIDLHKVQDLQQYAKENNMKAFIVNIWKKNDNKITIHEIDVNKDYSKEIDTFKNINWQTAGTVIKAKQKPMVHFPLKGIKIYDWQKK